MGVAPVIPRCFNDAVLCGCGLLLVWVGFERPALDLGALFAVTTGAGIAFECSWRLVRRRQRAR